MMVGVWLMWTSSKQKAGFRRTLPRLEVNLQVQHRPKQKQSHQQITRQPLLKQKNSQKRKPKQRLRPKQRQNLHRKKSTLLGKKQSGQKQPAPRMERSYMQTPLPETPRKNPFRQPDTIMKSRRQQMPPAPRMEQTHTPARFVEIPMRKQFLQPVIQRANGK